MIGLQENGKQLVISYKGSLFVKHTPDNSFIALGKGDANYAMFQGNFKIQENLEEKIILTDFEILENKEYYVKIKFSKKGLHPIVVVFEVIDDRLKLNFEEKPADFNRSWIRFCADEKEHIYGCGEQFSEVDLRGKKLPLWVSEQGVGRNKNDYITFRADVEEWAGGDWYTTYYPQPTFVSSENYWCHVEDSHYMEFDFTDLHNHELCIWNIPDEIVISKKESALEVLQDLTDYFGRQPELPDWSFDGVWLGLQGGTEVVMDKLRTAQDYGMNVAALWCQDWEGKRFTKFGKRLFWDWDYDEELYPNLPETIKELNKEGIKYLGYINTFLSRESKLYEEAAQKGYVVKNKNGEEYSVYPEMNAITIDLTNPEANEWMKNIIKENMIGIGLSGWMCDFGEFLPADAELYSGESAESYHNKYPAQWAKVNREAVQEAGKEGEVTFFTRAGYTGTAKYSYLMWAGDQMVNWCLDDGLASVIPAALSLGMTGFGLSHSDIGGYTTLFGVKRSKELFLRWAELAAFTPVMRTHEGNRPDDNWQFDTDEETLYHLAKMSKVYTKLKPYIKDAVKENSEKGIPVQRHPYIHYEDDEELHKLKYQYLFGRDLMVAPVYEENQDVRKVYLPDDNWIHIWSGEEYGKGYHEIKAPIGEIPVFYRKESSYTDLFEKIKDIK